MVIVYNLIPLYQLKLKVQLQRKELSWSYSC